MKLFGHSIKHGLSGFGSIDPWTLEYRINNNIPFMGTSEVAHFVLIDGDHIYKIRNALRFFDELKSPEITSWDEVLKILDKYVVEDFGSLSEDINRLSGV